MKIKKLEIVNFGKFSNFTLNLEHNFQLIYGNNEDGKSTIMAFILLMFYSNHGRVQALEQKPRQLYTPWNGANMEGAVEFSHDAKDYRLEKLFGEQPSKDKTNLINLSTSKEVKLPKNTEIGKYFLGLDLSAFKRTGFIQQLGSITAEKNDDIAEKLILNLVKGDSEESSQQAVIQRLEDAKYKLVSRNGTKGFLAEKNAELDSLKGQETQLKLTLQEQSEIQQQYNLLKKQQAELSLLENNLERYKQNQSLVKVKNLLEKSQELSHLEQSLFNREHNSSNFQDYLDKINNLSSSIEQTKNTLASLGDSANQSEITRDDAELHSSLLDTITRLQLLHQNQWQTISTLKSRLALNNQGKKHSHRKILQIQQNDTLFNNKTEYDTLVESKKNLEISKENLEEEIDGKSIQLNKKNIEFQKEQQLENEKNVKKMKASIRIYDILIIIFIIAIVIFWVITQPLIASIIALPLIGVLAARIFFTAKNKGAVTTASPPDSEIVALQNQLSALNNNLDYIQKQLTQTNDQITSLNFDQEHYQSTAYQLEQSKLSLARLEQEEKTLNETHTQTTLGLQTELVKIGIEHYDDFNLDDVISDYKNQLVRFLTQKGFDRSSAFNEAYISSQAVMENKEKNDTLNRYLEKQTSEYIALLSSMRPTANTENAQDLLVQLNGGYNNYIKLKDEATITAKTLGLQSYSIKELNAIIEKATNTSLLLSISQVEEIQVKVEELKAKNLIKNMEDLRQKLYPIKIQPEQISLQLVELQKQVDEASDYYNALNVALAMMKDADEEIKTSFGPILNQKTSKIFSQLTDQKYTDLLINNEYEIRVKTGVHFREWQYLSSGTIDQAYLALRLAVSELVSETGFKMLLLLDDVLINYDDDRAHKAMIFLKQYAENENIQIVLFSCHNRMKDFGNDISVVVKSL